MFDVIQLISCIRWLFTTG